MRVIKQCPQELRKKSFKKRDLVFGKHPIIAQIFLISESV